MCLSAPPQKNWTARLLFDMCILTGEPHANIKQTVQWLHYCPISIATNVPVSCCYQSVRRQMLGWRCVCQTQCSQNHGWWLIDTEYAAVTLLLLLPCFRLSLTTWHCAHRLSIYLFCSVMPSSLQSFVHLCLICAVDPGFALWQVALQSYHHGSQSLIAAADCTSDEMARIQSKSAYPKSNHFIAFIINQHAVT